MQKKIRQHEKDYFRYDQKYRNGISTNFKKSKTSKTTSRKNSTFPRKHYASSRMLQNFDSADTRDRSILSNPRYLAARNLLLPLVSPVADTRNAFIDSASLIGFSPKSEMTAEQMVDNAALNILSNVGMISDKVQDTFRGITDGRIPGDDRYETVKSDSGAMLQMPKSETKKFVKNAVNKYSDHVQKQLTSNPYFNIAKHILGFVFAPPNTPMNEFQHVTVDTVIPPEQPLPPSKYKNVEIPV